MEVKADKPKVHTKEKEYELVGASSGSKTLEKDYFDKVMSWMRKLNLQYHWIIDSLILNLGAGYAMCLLEFSSF